MILRLESFDSPAEIEMPPANRPIRGVAILFAGSNVADKDGAIVGEGSRIVSPSMRQVADHLACAGYASLRYNKRFVTDATSVNRERFDRLHGRDLVADGVPRLRLSAPGQALRNCRSFWWAGVRVPLSLRPSPRSSTASALGAE